METQKSIIFFFNGENSVTGSKIKGLGKEKMSMSRTREEKKSRIRANEVHWTVLYRSQQWTDRACPLCARAWWARPATGLLLRRGSQVLTQRRKVLEHEFVITCDHEGPQLHFLWSWTFWPQEAWWLSIFFRAMSYTRLFLMNSILTFSYSEFVFFAYS